MNENINLTKILKDCPKGWKLYSSIHGEVQFGYINNGDFPIVVELFDSSDVDFTKDGKLYSGYDGECVLFPSKEQRDWSKFTAPWYKKNKFDPKTLQAFDKILLRDECGKWHCGSFSHINKDDNYKFGYFELKYKYYIPYNDETRYLIDTTDEAPEYYRYWED